MSEFLSEDLYGDPQSIQDVVNQLGNIDPNEFYNLQQNLQQLQFLNPSLFGDFSTVNQLSGIPTVNPADSNSYSGMINGQAIMNQVNQNLSSFGSEFETTDQISPTDFSRIRDDQGRINPIWTYLLANMGRSDLLETGGELLERIAELAAQGRPVAPADLESASLTQEDVDSFTQAIQEITEAGGFDEWLESQQQEDDNDQEEEEGDVVFGDAGGLEDSTRTSTEIIFDEYGNPVEIVIDPTLITLPRILGERPDEQEEGEGEGDGGGSGGGQGSGTGSGTGQNQNGQQGEYEYPDYPQGDPNYGYPNGLPGGGRGGTIYDVPVQEEPGFTVVPAIPSISTGGGGGGGGGGGSAATKRSTPNDFTPFMRRLNYQPVALTKPILPQAPIVSGLFKEYLK